MGVLILTVTAVLMLHNVERAFNNIWRNRANRGAVSSFLLYWAVLSLAPVMLGLGLGIQAYLYAVANALAGLDSLGISTLVLSLLPFTLSVLGLTALYMTVPNCAVRLQHALVGGLVAAIAFSLARATFTTVIANSSYTLVYGAFAAVPVFLLWLYIIWSIILVGAILVHSLSDYQNAAQANRPTLLKALDVLYLMWCAQRQGTPVSEAALLRDRDVVIGGLDGESWRFIRDQLIDARLIAQNTDGNFLLSRDLNRVTVDDLKKLINSERPVADTPGKVLAWQQMAQQLLQQQRSAQQQQLGVTLTELFNHGARP
jgi:membrane protein